MANNGPAQITATSPVVKFAFQVKWDDAEIVFQEVNGLTAETPVVEYRAGKAFSTTKMPGISKFGNVTFKRGIFKGDTTQWAKFYALKMNTNKRSQITINLLDESNAVTMSWTLLNAFLTKVAVTDLKSDPNTVVVESLELAHEGLTTAS